VDAVLNFISNPFLWRCYFLSLQVLPGIKTVCTGLIIISRIASKGELSFPWNLLLYGYKTIIPSPAGDSVLLLGPVTRLVSKLSREDRTIGIETIDG
jgi:hypothetical protein